MTDLVQQKLMNVLKQESMRERAFACYYFIKMGRADVVKEYICSIKNDIGTTIIHSLDRAYWLWSVGEYVSETNSFNDLGINMNTINDCIQCIKTDWEQESSHWLEKSISGIFTSNIAIMYGAINSINKFLHDSELKELLHLMKNFTYIYSLREGEYVGEKGSSSVLGDMGDISILAVPFKLVNLDDLFLNRTINSVEKKLLDKGVCFSKNNYDCGDSGRADLTCLLSWYYSEAGYMDYAEWLLDQAAGMMDGALNEGSLDDILFAIAQHNLNSKKLLEKESFFKGANVFHKPAGENDPYSSRNYERYPRYPEVNDSVYLNINTQPFHPDQEVYVVYSINGIPKTKLAMHIEIASDGEQYWQAYIGKFNFSDKVNYKFEVQFKGEKVVSQEYSFYVRQWHSLKEIEHVYDTSDGMKLIFKRVGNLKKWPCVRIGQFNGVSQKFSFSMEDGEKSNEFGNIIEKGELEKNTYKIGNSIADFECLLDLLLGEDDRVHKVKFNLPNQDSEKIFGMGERFSHIEFNGLEVDCSVYNKYKNHGLKTYLPVPFFVSSNDYGVYFDSTTYVNCKFGSRVRNLTEVEINLENNKYYMDYYIFTGKPQEIIQEYTRLSGKPVLPPKWSFGLMVSSNSWNSQKDVYEQLDYARQYEIPISSVILEQWSDEATFYIFNEAKYDVKPGEHYFKYDDFKFLEEGKWPNPKKMVDTLHESGIRVLLWQAPYQMYYGSVVDKQSDADEQTMLNNNYHVRYKNGEAYRSHFYWFGHSLLPDFTNPEATEWWMKKREYLIRDVGIDGFKTDGGECILDEGLLFHNGKTEVEMRNEYPNDFTEAYYNFVQHHVKGGGIAFSRAGCQGAQKFPVHWAGDDVSTFKAFREAVNAGLSSGISGIPFWGWDLGNFSGQIPTAELYVRSTQMSIFCPIIQYHSESMEKVTYDRTPWNIAEKTNSPYVIDIFKKYLDLRMNILPYIYQQAVISSTSGIPMMRAMFIMYPEDSQCTSLTEQYMFGNHMLVAPVMEEGASNRQIYLPKGQWMNFFTGEVFSGSEFIQEETNIEEIPVFIKENSIIPLNLSNEILLFSHVGNDMEGYQNLCFLVYITDNIQYEFFDDLGNQMTIVASIQEDTITLSSEGNYTQSITFIFANIPGVHNVQMHNNETKKIKLNRES